VDSRPNDAVLVAEGTFALYTLKRSSYKTADCISVLFRRIFPDSEIACRFSSPQTKIEAIINLVITLPAIENIMQLLTNNSVSYCGVTTNTNSHNAVKVFPVVIQYFDWKKWLFTIKVN
jgi:hypothetical protein